MSQEQIIWALAELCTLQMFLLRYVSTHQRAKLEFTSSSTSRDHILIQRGLKSEFVSVSTLRFDRMALAKINFEAYIL